MIHAVELGRNTGTGSWSEETDIGDGHVDKMAGTATKSEGEGAYIEPTIANGPKTSDKSAGEVAKTDQHTGDVPRGSGLQRTDSPPKVQDPLDLWRSEPPTTNTPFRPGPTPLLIRLATLRTTTTLVLGPFTTGLQGGKNIKPS